MKTIIVISLIIVFALWCCVNVCDDYDDDDYDDGDYDG